jgi:hypothetical protein
MSNQHQYTVEVIYHFTCGCCNNWWSYAETPPTQKSFKFGVTDKRIYCPHCGRVRTAKIKEGFWLENNAEKT